MLKRYFQRGSEVENFHDLFASKIPPWRYKEQVDKTLFFLDENSGSSSSEVKDTDVGEF